MKLTQMEIWAMKDCLDYNRRGEVFCLRRQTMAKLAKKGLAAKAYDPHWKMDGWRLTDAGMAELAAKLRAESSADIKS